MAKLGVRPGELRRHVEAVRRFNRFYTRRIGVLQEGHLYSPFSLTEARVLYEIAQRQSPTASDLVEALGIDAGYLSRMLRRFEEQALVARRPSATDRRQSHLELSRKGRKAFAALDTRAASDVAAMLQALPEGERGRVTQAMESIAKLLGPGDEAGTREPCLLREHQPGDMGWVVERHGVLYREEYGFDERFEALVAHVVADFIDRFDRERERCWIAERDGERVGSVFLVRDPEDPERTAKLRLLLVEPSARGLGLGRRLVRECTRFARRAGYSSIELWTNSILAAARALYQAEGYQLVSSEPHRRFGPRLVGETWKLDLTSSPETP